MENRIRSLREEMVRQVKDSRNGFTLQDREELWILIERLATVRITDHSEISEILMEYIKLCQRDEQ